MYVRCEQCGRMFDDEFKWTICPHRHLWFSPTENEMDETNQKSVPQPHPAVAGVLQFFTYEHLPIHLQEISQPFCTLAMRVAGGPQNAETTVALRKLLEAKDAAVRALIFK